MVLSATCPAFPSLRLVAYAQPAGIEERSSEVSAVRKLAPMVSDFGRGGVVPGMARIRVPLPRKITRKLSIGLALSTACALLTGPASAQPREGFPGHFTSNASLLTPPGDACGQFQLTVQPSSPSVTCSVPSVTVAYTLNGCVGYSMCNCSVTLGLKYFLNDALGNVLTTVIAPPSGFVATGSGQLTHCPDCTNGWTPPVASTALSIPWCTLPQGTFYISAEVTPMMLSCELTTCGIQHLVTGPANQLNGSGNSYLLTDALPRTLRNIIKVVVPPPLSVTTTTASCSGSATAYPAGGCSPYSYSWTTTPAQSTATATNLSTGTYSVTATDAYGCTETGTASVFSCVTPPPGLVDWWPFEGPAGAPAPDIAGAIANNALALSLPTYGQGKVGNALCLGSGNDSLRVADESEVNFLGDCRADVPDEFTIDGWVKTTDSIKVTPILDKRLSPKCPQGYFLYLSNGRLGFQMGNGETAPCFDDYVSAAPAGLVADGQWHHIAVTVKRFCHLQTGSVFEGYLYVDGNPVPVIGGTPFGPRSGSIANHAQLRIGRKSSGFGGSGPDSFRGCIDEFEIFKRALTPAEILSIYKAGNCGKCK
jgi:Concanavalin A-like lectin/glucanases superfamily